ncbi:MAG: GMC family oxidoreductase, partial [Actinomycetia bacterium]|nr:GMC family oxidoreductase [Actinomycetes bacterium]
TAASITTRHGLRHGAAEAFVGSGPALGSPSGDGIDLMAESPVRRVLFSAGAAVGVELIDGSRLGGGTVVLSAGALNSPALLRASGVESVGDERPVVDHPSFVFPIALRPEYRCPLDQAVVPISGVVRWSARIGVTGRPQRMADLMAFVMDHVGSGPDGRRFGAIVLVLADVASVGSLRWTGDKMRLDPGWLNHDLDRQTLIMGARQIAALLRSGPVASAAEGVFVDDVGTNLDVFERLTDVELGDWLVTHPGPIAHPGASCSPVLNGTPGPGLVDLDGAVRGHRRLHVIDGSTLPYLPAANPQLPIMALATRLSSDL